MPLAPRVDLQIHRFSERLGVLKIDSPRAVGLAKTSLSSWCFGSWNVWNCENSQDPLSVAA